MRLRRREAPQLGVLGALALAATLLSVAAGAGGASHEDDAARRPSAWRGLVGTPRQQVAVGQRVIVVLNSPSLSDRVAAAGGKATEAQQRRWTAAALAADNLLISRLAQQGVKVEPEHRYARVLTGFSAPLDPSAVALLERAPEVAGVYPVRVTYPASTSSTLIEKGGLAAGVGATPDVDLPGLRRPRRDDRAARHRRRADPSVPPRPGGRRLRRRRPGQGRRLRRRAPRIRPDSSGTAPSWPGCSSGSEGPAEDERRCPRRDVLADPRRGLAARGRRALGRLRANRPAHRRARARGRPERGRRRARCRAGRARGSRGAVRGVRGQPLRAGGRRGAAARHARRRPGRQRRGRRARATAASPGREGPARRSRSAPRTSGTRPPRSTLVLRTGLGVFFDREAPLAGAVAPSGGSSSASARPA